MREIKFRVWDKINHPAYKKQSDRMSFFGPEMFIDDDGFIMIFCEPGKGVIGDHDQSRHKLMQYTGLKDKNGVDIYEGDVLRDGAKAIEGEVIHECVWDKESAAFTFDPFVIKRHGYGFGGYEEMGHSLDELKPAGIIGNIYENPELLN